MPSLCAKIVLGNQILVIYFHICSSTIQPPENQPSTSSTANVLLSIGDMLKIREEMVDPPTESNLDETHGSTETPKIESYDGAWIFEKEFENKVELHKLLESESCWSIRSTTNTAKGKKTLYRCNLVKIKANQCHASIYTLHGYDVVDDDVDSKCTLFRKKLNHTHADSIARSVKVPEKTKKIVIQHYLNRNTAKSIVFLLRDDESIPQNEQPSYNQIKNIIKNHKRGLYGSSPINMKEIDGFAKEHLDVPEEDDKAFVVAYNRSPSTQQGDKYFRIFVSTRRLLQMASLARNLHADSTHKVTVEKLPLIAIGSTDMNRTFHLIGLTISNHEKTDDFEFSFNAVKCGINQITGIDIQPAALISDAAKAIHLGFEKVFGNLTIIMCYAHVMSNVSRKYKFNGAKNKIQFQKDVRVLHNCDCMATFEIGCKLFKKKWHQREPKATATIDKSFFQTNKNWFIGAAHRVPKTNNAMESFNASLKLYQTHHQRVPLKQFKDSLLKIVEQRSKEYKVDKPAFQSELKIPEKMLIEGCKMDLKFYASVPKESGGIDIFTFRSDIDKDIEEEDVDSFKNIEYGTFTDFTQNSSMIWKMSFPKSPDDWEQAVCTCPAFDADYICKHIIAVAHNVKLVTAPKTPEANYDDEPLFPKNKGRPKKTSSALEME